MLDDVEVMMATEEELVVLLWLVRRVWSWDDQWCGWESCYRSPFYWLLLQLISYILNKTQIFIICFLFLPSLCQIMPSICVESRHRGSIIKILIVGEDDRLQHLNIASRRNRLMQKILPAQSWHYRFFELLNGWKL